MYTYILRRVCLQVQVPVTCTLKAVCGYGERLSTVVSAEFYVERADRLTTLTCESVCMYVCAYIYIYIYIYESVCMHIYIFIHTYIHT